MRISQVKPYLFAIVYIFCALFLALALWSYNPADPSFNSIGQRQFALNYCGLFGSFLSDALLQLLGITAWGFVALFAVLAAQSVKKEKMVVTVEAAAIGMLMMLNVASLMALHFSAIALYDKNIHLGGVLGRFFFEQLKRLFNGTGVGLILWATFLALAAVAVGPKALSRTFDVRFDFSFLKTFFLGIAAQAKALFARKQRPQSFPQKAQNLTFKPQIEQIEVVEDQESMAQLAPESESGPVRRRKVDLRKKVQRKIANWKLPEIGMLEDPPESRYKVDEKEIRQKSTLLVDKLGQFSVKGEVKGARPGPAVTLFEFKPNADVKISKITELADDLSLALSSESIRIIAPIPGRDVVGIETANTHRETVYLKDVLALDDFWSDEMKLPIALGRQADGEPKVVDLRKMPHLLVAGTTGSGKSVFIVCMLTGLLFRHSPQSLRLILIDPKQVDLAAFNNIPHLLLPMVTEPKKAVGALNWAVREMEKRYRSMSRFGARGIEAFNETVAGLNKEQIEEHETINQNTEHQSQMYYFTPQPYIVIVVEEFGDLMAVDKANAEHAVVRLAQMARASGIHLVLAMQSPRKDVVTGLIKTNIPGRISFKVASKMDSRIILDDSGAERLLARGDMLFQAPGVAKPERHHGPWVTEEEIASIMSYWADQGQPEYDEVAMSAINKSVSGDTGGEWDGEMGDAEYDEKYDEILAWASGLKTVSASLIQRKFRLGYPRAARLIEIFEREGVVGPANGSKPRDVLVRAYNDESP
ncbi:MAG: DNA translocase FtsK 4TM domain-containing protein [Bdellovibrionaceae bacterium]|nr:DNA translocase FtsK 4TM domain-containing protein [Pseudobdellovibrionaceae bacterium]